MCLNNSILYCRRLFFFLTALNISLAIVVCANAEPTNKISLSQVSASFTGENKYDNAASSVSYAGDVNGDGIDDFIVAAHNNDDGGENAGKVYLVFGKITGWGMYQTLHEADVSFIGEESNDNAGIAVSYAGDVNADGFDDIIIGAYGNDHSGENSGICYLIFGKKKWDRVYDLEKADVAITGEREEDTAGGAVSYA